MGILSIFKVPGLADSQVGPTGPMKVPDPVGPQVALPTQGALTSGSDLDRTAIGPWPPLMDASIANDSFTGYTPNGLHDWFQARVGANYGLRTSLANFGFKFAAFGVGSPDNNGQGSIGLYPGPVPNSTRPTYDNLEPIQWNVQALDVLNTNPQAWATIQNGSTEFIPGGTASLGIQAPTLV